MRGLPIGLIAALVATSVAARPTAEPAHDVTYQGFVLDGSAIAADPDAALLLDAARAQVDLVLHVGLTPASVAVLRGFPIHLGRGPGGGHFGRDGVFVNLPPRPDPRPILLHELMHAYQARRLPGGGGNPDLQRFFAEAKAPGVWPAGSYMLTNINEYFAMTASVYVNGSAARPPFTRAALEEKQPAYAAWLARTVR